MSPYRKIDFESVRNNTDNLCLEGNLLLCDSEQAVEMDAPVILDGISVIGICLEGNALLEIGSISHNVRGGMALILFPGESFRLSGTSLDLNIKFIIFKENFIRWKGDILNTVSLNGDMDNLHLLPLPEESMRECITTYEIIRRRLKRRTHKLMYEVLTHHLQILIYDIYDSSEADCADAMHTEHSSVRNVFKQFLSLVSNQYREHQDVSYYADRLYVSPKYLSRIVFTTSGRHASEWITDALMTEAKICLRMTEMSLADISARLNFSSPSHFGRFFKRHTGLTPKQFRNR